MEFTKMEIAVVENTVAATEQMDQVELNDLQLALVGGGFAETSNI